MLSAHFEGGVKERFEAFQELRCHIVPARARDEAMREPLSSAFYGARRKFDGRSEMSSGFDGNDHRLDELSFVWWSYLLKGAGRIIALNFQIGLS